MDYNELTVEQIEALSDEELLEARETYGNREMYFLCAEGNDWSGERCDRDANNERLKASDNEIKKRFGVRRCDNGIKFDIENR